MKQTKMQTKIGILSGLLALTFLVGGCATTTPVSEKVATVNGTVITKADYDKTYAEFVKAIHLDMLPKDQQARMEGELKQMTVQKLIYQTLIHNEAQKDGVQITDAEVQQYKQDKIFSNPMLKDQFKTFLSKNNMQESDFDRLLKDNLLLTKLVEIKGGKEVQVNDADVKSFYDKNAEQFKIPARIHASHILVKAIVPEIKHELREKNPKLSDAEIDKDVTTRKQEQKTKADKLFAEVKADPAKFPALAQKNSDDPMSAKQGGDLGYLIENNIDPSFWAAAAKTPNGQFYPGVVESQFGYHIIKVLDRQPPHVQTFAEAKDMIKERMGQEKKQIFLQKWAEQQKQTAKIEVEPAYQAKPSAAPEVTGSSPLMQPQQGPPAAQPAPAGKHE